MTVKRNCISGMELRVPIPVCGLLDFTVRICKSSKLSDINYALKDASQCSLSGILCYTEEEVVSTDFIGTTNTTKNRPFFSLVFE